MSIPKIGVGVVAAVLLTAGSMAQAAPITLTLQSQPAHTVGPNSESAPCIIAGTHCQNPVNFPYTDFVQAGNISAYDEDSPIYTIDQFPFLSFAVAIDVNTAREAGEALQLFDVFVDADGAAGAGGFAHIYNFTGPSLIGTVASNGNGYGDWTLEQIDLTSYATNALVYFNAVWDGSSSGAESYFIVEREGPPPCSPTDPACNPCLPEDPSCNPTVPEPGAVALMGLGLLGVVGMRRRRQ